MLLSERNKREKPAKDDKILTAWNALMLQGYADAYAAFGNESFLQRALQNAEFIADNMLLSDGHLWRSFRKGQASVYAFLEDYALLAKAYITLYQVTFDKRWLTLAQKITDYAIANFYDQKDGMFYYTAGKGNLVIRKKELPDNTIPSSNAVIAEVMYLLGTYFDNSEYIDKSKLMARQIAGKKENLSSYYSEWAYLTGLLSYGTQEVAIMGKDAHRKNLELQKNYLPGCIFMGETKEENLPLLENKLPENNTLIYVCTNKACKLPVENTDKALLQIR
jgi:uncharacterized protein YyaL (SSP411 family)